MTTHTYRTHGGIDIRRYSVGERYAGAIDPLQKRLDRHRGVLLASSFEYPGRYTRWDIGFADPPIAVEARGRDVAVVALNARGQMLLPAIEGAFSDDSNMSEVTYAGDRVTARPEPVPDVFPESERSRMPSTFSAVRALRDLFASGDDPHLGLYGAFGYDLVFAFEPMALQLDRPAEQRDMVLYLPDEILIVDHQRQTAIRHLYDFEAGGQSTRGIPRDGALTPYRGRMAGEVRSDHAPGEYAGLVREAKKRFECGDLFEVVPGQLFSAPCPDTPSDIFARLKERNPAPYGALMNLGDGEYLVAASPEMFVRVEGNRVETCPISGTIARGSDALEDADRIRELLNSDKDASELTMCTDVDRNDKSRVCEAGSVRVIGRRQIEMYSRLIHTVDHVEGRLKPGCDALDAFLAHSWAVTVTGAPKRAAIVFLEGHEKSPRRWYGGAIGMVGFDGNMNTGLTLRTVRIDNGIAEVRAGATLLFDSDPDAEEAETRLKASAMLDAILNAEPAKTQEAPQFVSGRGKRVLLVDHEDSFVHTLAGYLEEQGAKTETWRAGFPDDVLDRFAPDLIVLSPGPGRPEDFDMSATIGRAVERGIPLFGVCLGLQGIGAHFGGRLGQLPEPVHGKPSMVIHGGEGVFAGLPGPIQVGRYHSLYLKRDNLPPDLEVTAETGDGAVMALRHKTLPIVAVQFHPESILCANGDTGKRLIANVLEMLVTPRQAAAA